MVIYFGGVSRGCKQPNLTAAWVTAQRAAGWKLIPIYVGPQAPCTKSKSKHKLSLTTPAKDAQAAAADAVAQARSARPEAGQRADLRHGVLRRRRRLWSGGADLPQRLDRKVARPELSVRCLRRHLPRVSDLVAAPRTPGFVPPDHLDFARWNNVATLTDVAIPADQWAGRRRMKQYRGPHKETWGGVTINIDSNLRRSGAGARDADRRLHRQRLVRPARPSPPPARWTCEPATAPR